MESIKEFLDKLNNRDNQSPFPYGKSVGWILSVIVAVIGLIIFSYVAQDPSCTLYSDWRRTFSNYAVILLFVGTVVYMMPFIGAILEGKTGGDLLSGIVVVVVMTILFGSLLASIGLYTTKNAQDFALANPKQRMLAIITSGVLVLGSTLPLMSYLGTKILNPRIEVIY